MSARPELRIVLIEDNPADAALVAEQLTDSDLDGYEEYRLSHFSRLASARDHLTAHGADCVLLDLSLPDAEGSEAVEDLRRHVPAVPLVVLSGTRDRELILGTLRAGAQDYLVKGNVDTDLLSRAIRHAIERLRFDEALRAQQEQSRLIIETASDPFVSVDGDGCIADWNQSAEHVFGWTRAEVVGRTLTDTIFVDGLPGPYAEFLCTAVRPPTNGSRTEAIAADRSGRRLPVEVVAWSVGTGPDRRVHAFVHDITERLELQAERELAKARKEREQYERRLQQAQRLEALGQLAGGVAHDFNNLLAIITNYVEFVAEDIDLAAETEPDRWQGIREDVRHIMGATERAIRLTRQLLAFGRRDVTQPQVLRLDSVLTDVEPLLRRAVGEQVTMIVDAPSDLWSVAADPGQIEQVLLNLAVNARDAMQSRGVLSIALENATLSEPAAARMGLSAGPHVRLAVTDTGAGMSQEALDRAFEPFFTSKPDGTGLGLAMVYGVVTQAGGQVHIESQPGRGTSIVILLPATGREPSTSGGMTPVPGGAQGETVLVVEDEPELREVVRRILNRNGYRVITADDAVHAVELVKEQPDEIQLLLTDVVMPKSSGLQVAARITELRPGIRVLYMSGYAHTTLAAHGASDAEITLISKPFSEAALLAQIRRLLDAA